MTNRFLNRSFLLLLHHHIPKKVGIIGFNFYDVFLFIHSHLLIKNFKEVSLVYCKRLRKIFEKFFLKMKNIGQFFTNYESYVFQSLDLKVLMSSEKEPTGKFAPSKGYLPQNNSCCVFIIKNKSFKFYSHRLNKIVIHIYKKFCPILSW